MKYSQILHNPYFVEVIDNDSDKIEETWEYSPEPEPEPKTEPIPETSPELGTSINDIPNLEPDEQAEDFAPAEPETEPTPEPEPEPEPTIDEKVEIAELIQDISDKWAEGFPHNELSPAQTNSVKTILEMIKRSISV